MSKEVALPNVQVIENGKPVSNERIDPGVMQFIAQMATLSQLNRMRKLEESKIPTGTSSYVLDLTTSITEFKIAYPWISFSITNAGPDRARMTVGHLEAGLNDEADIDQGQTLNFNFNFPVIKILYLRAVSSNCQVRIYAVEGGKK